MRARSGGGRGGPLALEECPGGPGPDRAARNAAQLGVEGQTGAFRTPSGETLLAMKAGTTDTASAGIILLLHRAELLDVLHRVAGPDIVRLGARCIGLDQDAVAVTAVRRRARDAG